MRPKEAIGPEEQRYLQAVYDLASGEAKVPVAFGDVREYLSCDQDEADRCSDFWARLGVLEWPILGHIALTHVGLSQALRLRSAGDSTPIKRDDDQDAPVSSVSVVIPVLNEAGTIEHLVKLARRDPRVLEVVVVDDGSIDGSVEIASDAGASVMMSSLLGKGASMEDGVGAASGDTVLFLDGDLKEVAADLVELMTEPIASNRADLVKASFTRDAGRVTALTARPLLSAFFPELSAFEQPLGGIVAARRSLLANIQLERDYGADVGLLIDAAMRGARVLEVDIGRIDHDSQSLESLGFMAKQVTRVILDRAWRHERLSINQVREVEELERRARAGLLHPPLQPDNPQKLALFDMDGVLLEGRFVAALAEKVGVESDLARLLDNRLVPDGERTRLVAALFTGVYAEVFEETARSMPLVEGAIETMIALRRAGYRVGIVTDSFHIAAETIRRRVFADFAVAHILHFHNGRSTGEVTLSSLMMDPAGCSQHTCCKSNVLKQLCDNVGIMPAQALAVGDGENDVCMLKEAGTSVAFRPRSELVEQAAKYTVRGSLLDVVDLLGEGVDLGDCDRDPSREDAIRFSVPVSEPTYLEDAAAVG